MNNASVWNGVLAERHGDKVKDATAPAGPTASKSDGSESAEVAAIRERVFAEERDRALAIISACDLAGAPARAAAFIKSGKPVSEVIAALGSAHARPKG